eukprot:Lithocolla_globosa_v1_NODE_3183_length_1738_cov_15.576946.p1 type:complete len:449 gc:universal NODE_3183_length_1738_cov_15.576946:137-1483(+)
MSTRLPSLLKKSNSAKLKDLPKESTDEKPKVKFDEKVTVKEVEVDKEKSMSGMTKSPSAPALNQHIKESIIRPIHRVGSSPVLTDALTIGPEDFKILKLLGKGDTGRVYLVEKKSNSKLFAMKVLSKDEMLRRKKVKRAMTERDILMSANHPFIVSMYHSFQSKDFLFFVMEYCAGGEFFRTLQKQPKKRVQEDAAKFYVAEVILALEYLHLMGYIYRDLKPENILLHESGHVRLTDFDLSKQAEGGDADIFVSRTFGRRQEARGIDTAKCSRIKTNSFVGTEEFIAPEVIKGKGYTGSVDWWTVGIFLYEMLFGRTPFKGQDRSATFDNILENGVYFPEEPHISSHAKNFIRKLLQKNDKKRLGATHGAAELKRHTWFANIKWPLLMNMTPPLLPQIKDPMDTANFRVFDEAQQKYFNFDNEKNIPNSELQEDTPFATFQSVSLIDD